jgi:hypothetical protein
VIEGSGSTPGVFVTQPSVRPPKTTTSTPVPPMVDPTMVVGSMTPWLVVAGVVVAVLILAVVGCVLVSVRTFSWARYPL